jgi:hypothetical protein
MTRRNYKNRDIPREVARQLKESLYVPLKPCVRHPLALFDVRTGLCVVCGDVANATLDMKRKLHHG